MEFRKLLYNKLTATGMLLGLSLFGHDMQAQTNITVDAAADWIGSMNVYEPNGTYLWSNGWGFADLKAEKNTENNTITLYPNYNVYNADDAYWVSNGQGIKVMEALPHVDANNLLGQNVTFSGEVTSYTLASGYTVQAYIKVAMVQETEPYYTPVGEASVNITGAGNFTLNYDTTALAGSANHLEYGFIVKGLNANPDNAASLGSVVITAGEPETPTEPETTVVTLDAGDQANIIGYANWFQLDGTTYIGGNTYDVANLKTEINTANNTLILHPNFFAYGDGTNPDWANNGMGTRVFEGNTYVEDNTLLGKDIAFKGNCNSNTLAEGYVARAFIKVMSASYDMLNYTPVVLENGADFEISVNVASYPNAAHVQYGYSVTGRNANPTQEATLGSAIVGSATASVKDFSKKAVTVYPNPATNILNVSATDSISNISVYNMLGQQVIGTMPNATDTTLNVSSLTAGIYMVNTTAGGKTSAVRFVKQ